MLCAPRQPEYHRGACVFLNLALSFSLLAIAPPALTTQDEISRRRQEYERQRDAVGKAKKLPKLGEAHLDAARRAIRDDNIPLAITLLQEHRDLLTSTREALLAAIPNPEKKPSGFKQMEIHVRKSLDQMTDIIAEAPASERAPFEAIRADLDRLNRQLIRDLFPRQPGTAPPRSNP
jgi:hypothetical protein